MSTMMAVSTVCLDTDVYHSGLDCVTKQSVSGPTENNKYDKHITEHVEQ